MRELHRLNFIATKSAAVIGLALAFERIISPDEYWTQIFRASELKVAIAPFPKRSQSALKPF
ncbi:MAG: hypothetical protein HY785_12760 [Oscillatoriophycideae cyanobacterium NC_groundwater_1537_Pr4_S-0.65um_50_18]|nr:hypothetical protein [Oscillatoriophycideae cyanobacterium NC_groundwater_1537_Pr4_S-0.65um_50_18]